MRFLICLFLIFLFIYGPVFNNIGSWADSIFLFSIFIVALSSTFPKPHFPKYASAFLILFPFFICVSIIAISYPGIEIGDIAKIIIRPFRILLTVLAAYTLVRYIKNYYTDDFTPKIFEFIFLSVVIHAVIMLLQFINPDFKDLVYKWTASADYRSSFDYNFRMGGLSGGTGGAILSVVQSTGVIIAPFLFRYISKTKKVIYSVLCLLIVASILVCGRSGLWSTIVFLPISIFLADPKISASTILKFAGIAFAVIIVFLVVVSYMSELESNNPVFLALSRTLDTFLSFNESGEFDDRTTSVLASHVLFPQDVLTYLVGDTEHIINTQFGRVLDSDIGYIRNLWSFGIIGTFVFVFPMLRILLLSFNQRKYFISAAYLLILTILTLFFHMKENFMYTRMLFSIYSLTFAVLHFERLKTEKEKVNSITK
jgi:hypothetical protein